MCRMAYALKFILINFLLLHNGFCEINVEEKHRLFNGFLDSLNNLPNQLFIYEDGTIKDAQKVDENHYKITTYLKATELSNLDSTKHLHCKATICDLKQNGIVIENNTLECEDYQSKLENAGEGSQNGNNPHQSVTADSNEPTLTQDSVKLNNNEVLYNPVGTSDDVPIPRPKPSMPCIGCSSQVDPQAQGVEELAALGIKHLDKHDSEIKHKLDSVVEVTRQVQVVNGVRYILTLIVDKCKNELNECNEKVACKISILEKPWLKLPTGSKYRAILANNCTEQWQYGDDGEVITDANDDKASNKDSQGNEEVKVIHNTELQAQPHSEKSLTDEQIKDVQEQIIPYSEFQQTSLTNDFQNYGDPSVDYKQQVTQDETAKYFSENATPFKNSAKEANSATTLTDDKKKAIEELTNLFNFAGFNNNAFAQSPEYVRVRRSFNEDLQVMAMKPGIPSEIDGSETRSKRQLVGDQQEKNASDPQYHALAEESLQKYMLSSGSTQHHKVVNVDKVTVQVVSGSLTRIDFKIISTNCQLDSNGQPSSANCEAKVDADTISCHSEILEQPWLKKKEITVNCNVDETKTRVKRQYGGLQEQNPSDPQYHALAEESLQKYLLSSGNTQPHKVVKVDKVTVQVVSGSLTRIDFKIIPLSCPSSANCEAKVDVDTISCHSEIWEQSWLKKKDITVNCNIDESKTRRKRGLAGGHEEKNPEEPKYYILAEESLQKYLLLSGSTQNHKVIKVEKVTVQVVAGSLTRIDFTIIPTNCYLNSSGQPTSSNCDEQSNAAAISCHSEIWEQPWLNKKEITVNCGNDDTSSNNFKRKKRALVGGPQNKDVMKPIYRRLAEQSLRKFEHKHKSKQHYMVVDIKHVVEQVVSGFIYKIDYTATPTNCSTQISDVSKCHPLDSKVVFNCHTEIVDHVGRSKKKISVQCHEDLLNKDFTDEENTDDNNSHMGSFHRKRFTKGDHIFNRLKRQVDEDIDDDSTKIALHLANKAIAHIEAKYPTYRKQKLVRIFSIDKQNIAGIRYKMKIEVGFTDCWALSTKENCTLLKDYVIPNRFCRVNVWLRPWTENPPAYRVTCDHEKNLTGELYHNIQAQILFYNFVKQFSPSYAEDSTEMAKRFLIFKENIKKIHDLNIHERGTATYGITRFADLTYEEFATFFTGLKPNLRHANNVPMRKAHIPNIKLPQNFDWRDFNAVTEVKNQGSCGSCWAFSVTGNIEGQWKIHSGQLVSLSEQELVDCDSLDQGCNGGLPDNAYRAIEQLGGLETETEYPYQGDGEKCIFNQTLAKVQISGAVNISSNETDMAKWLVKKGPISIGINANAMQFYVGGVSHPWKMLCNPNNLDHGVLIVGYGIKEYPLFKKSLPYWTVKNSWGPSWGEQGYYRVYRGDGTCGLNLMASSAVIDHSQ